MPHNLGVLVEYAKKRGGKTVVVPDAEYNVAYTSGCGKAGQPRCVCPVAEQQFRASIDRKYHAWCSAEESCVCERISPWYSTMLRSSCGANLCVPSPRMTTWGSPCSSSLPPKS